jgi:hypothetical protein
MLLLLQRHSAYPHHHLCHHDGCLAAAVALLATKLGCFTKRPAFAHVLQDAAVGHCWELPPHTFGGSYAAFMGQRGFYADDRPVVRWVRWLALFLR